MWISFVIVQEWAKNTGRWSEGDAPPNFGKMWQMTDSFITVYLTIGNYRHTGLLTCYYSAFYALSFSSLYWGI